MVRQAKYLLLLLLMPGVFFSQLRVIKPVKKQARESAFGFGIGRARSVLYLPINVNNNNDARGINAIVTYDKGEYMRGALEYTYYGIINIAPTWKNVRAQTIECNLHFISRTKESSCYFYPIAGLSYNFFRGYFTGINDYLNLSAKYDKNVVVKTNWLGVNAGLGMDYNFENFSIYTSFKMRVGRSDGYNQLNIMDVFLVAGLRYTIKSSTLGKIFRGTRSRYTLSKKTPTNTPSKK